MAGLQTLHMRCVDRLQEDALGMYIPPAATLQELSLQALRLETELGSICRLLQHQRTLTLDFHVDSAFKHGQLWGVHQR